MDQLVIEEVLWFAYSCHTIEGLIVLSQFLLFAIEGPLLLDLLQQFLVLVQIILCLNALHCLLKQLLKVLILQLTHAGEGKFNTISL